MKILIAIPSKRRADVLEKNALKWVQHTGLDFQIFIEQDDFSEYEKISKNLIILPEYKRGLGYAKTIIKEYAEKNNYDLIIKIDDDVSGWTDYRRQLKGEEAGKRFRQTIRECEIAFEKYPDIAVIAFPYSFQMFEKRSFERTKRVQTAYIARTAYFHVDTRISVFEDFAVGINAITKNKLVMLYGMSGIVMGIPVGGGTGGHQSYDRAIQAEKEIEVLREIYPPLSFRKVEKPWIYEPDLASIKKIGFYK